MSQRPVVLGHEFTFNTRESLWLRSEGPFLVRVALQWDPNEPFDQNCISWPTPNPVLSQLRHHRHKKKKTSKTQHSGDKHKQYTLLSHCKTTDTVKWKIFCVMLNLCSLLTWVWRGLQLPPITALHLAALLTHTIAVQRKSGEEQDVFLRRKLYASTPPLILPSTGQENSSTKKICKLFRFSSHVTFF